MKQFMQYVKNLRKWFLTALVITSIALIAIDWAHMREITHHLSSVTWIGICLLITEAFFVIGALLMAISAGENLSEFKRLRHWPRRLSELRNSARHFAEKMILSRTFTIGFWLNFIGAVGTSLILIGAVIAFTPYTGFGILIVIIIDLIATFGWRIPLELTRRRAHRQHAIH